MAILDENEEQKTIEKLTKNALSEKETQEKLMLDFHFLVHEIETKVTDKKIVKELKKTITEFENALKGQIKIEITKKTIQNYIALKTSNFDPELLRLSKYIK